VQAPEFSQAFNRYSYCLNNPLKYTDITGMQYSYNWETKRYVDADGNEVEWSEVYSWLSSIGAYYSVPWSVRYESGNGGGSNGRYGSGGMGVGYLVNGVVTFDLPEITVIKNQQGQWQPYRWQMIRMSLLTQQYWNWVNDRSERRNEPALIDEAIKDLHFYPEGYRPPLPSGRLDNVYPEFDLLAGIRGLMNMIGGGTKYVDLVKSAQKLYPNKAGVTEMHHITPKYLGGTTNGSLVPLNGSYHQVITNEFRHLHPYGLPQPDPQGLRNILELVYRKYPLPPGYKY
jgi:hypothetical protein